MKTRGLRVEVFSQAAAGAPPTTMIAPNALLHEPGTTQAWTSAVHVCRVGTCEFDAFMSGQIVSWFDDQAVPPAPVNWDIAPVLADNSCYHKDADHWPDSAWKMLAMGCHDPLYERGSLDCNPGQHDAYYPDFCGGEVISLHYPPRGTWHRLAVSFDGSESHAQAPVLRIECNGRLAALLGPHGYGVPEAPLEFPPNVQGVWVAADVLFPPNDCDGACVVSPIYADAASRAPLVANGEFGPAYPPIP